jgi:deazaflavin-dependent oxidoreductase (nitroreductase family)
VRPGPVLRWALRLPVVAFDAGAGRLLGHRFLLLTHRGQRTGQLHRTVLEVLSWRQEAGEAVVLSGFGPRAQWLQNVLAGGAVEIRIGRERWRPVARSVEAGEAAAVLADYERRNKLLRPVVHRVLSQLAGVRYDGSAATRLELVRALTVVAFRPAPPGAS